MSVFFAKYKALIYGGLFLLLVVGSIYGFHAIKELGAQPERDKMTEHLKQDKLKDDATKAQLEIAQRLVRDLQSTNQTLAGQVTEREKNIQLLLKSGVPSRERRMRALIEEQSRVIANCGNSLSETNADRDRAAASAGLLADTLARERVEKELEMEKVTGEFRKLYDLLSAGVCPSIQSPSPSE